MVLLFSVLGAYAADPACPPGTGPAEKTEAGVVWRGCVRADGTWHGPVSLVEPDGSTWTGSLFDGLQHGPWIQSNAQGKKLAAGQFAAGQRIGDWLTWDDTGELRGKVEFAVSDAEPEATDTGGSALIETTEDDDPLVVVATANQLAAYGRADLSPVWTQPLASQPVDLVLADGLALVAEKDGHVTALDLDDGQVARVAVGASLASIVGLVDPSRRDVAIVLDTRGQAFAIDLWTGERLWRGESFFNPIRGAAEGRSVFLTRAKKLVRLRAADGSEEWSVKTPHLAADVLLAGDDVYVLDHEGTVTAYDTRKGQRRWSLADVLASSDVTTGALRWADGELVVRGLKRVAVLDAKGEELATFPMPAGARGRGDAWRARMVVADDAGNLVLSSGGGTHTIETKNVRGFEVLEHDIVVVDADGIETIDPADVELEGKAPPDADPLWDLRDGARTTVAGRSSALPMTVRLDADGTRALYVDATQVPHGDHVRVELGWTEDDRAGAFQFAEGWTVDDLPGEMTLALVQRWAPRAVQAWFRDAGNQRPEENDAFFDRVLHCEEPAVRYEGTMLLNDGHRDFRLEGSIDVEPERHTFSWGDACLLHVSTAHETFGVWSPPDAPAWVGLLLSGQSIVPTGDATLHGDESAHLSITYLEPRQQGPTTFELDGPFDLEIGEALAASGPHGSIRIETGEVHSLAEDGALGTWEVHHRWTAATTVDEPGWIRVGTVGPSAAADAD
jgi:outer membrane protein assembly factor BamB